MGQPPISMAMFTSFSFVFQRVHHHAQRNCLCVSLPYRLPVAPPEAPRKPQRVEALEVHLLMRFPQRLGGKTDLMVVFHGDFMGFNGDLMGFNCDFMGFDGDLLVI